MVEHLDQTLTLASVAARAHPSTRTLARRFHHETGQNLIGWIDQRRVERAQALLEETDLTVTEIAYGVGFGSTESLRRSFMRRTGTTPRDYRNTFQGRTRGGRRAGSGEYTAVLVSLSADGEVGAGTLRAGF